LLYRTQFGDACINAAGQFEYIGSTNTETIADNPVKIVKTGTSVEWCIPTFHLIGLSHKVLIGVNGHWVLLWKRGAVRESVW